jgi:dipeptidase E
LSIKKHIIALGGGGFSMEPDNLLLDEYVLKQSNKQNPKICFIGTASGDAESYIFRFYTSFLTLSCRPRHLSLFKLPTRDLESFLLDQDVIYVGGGNTRSLMALWKEWSIDDYLRTAWQSGVVLAGVSAGSICWFEEGLSDFFPSELNKVKCLGFLRGSNCPHYDSEPGRRPVYQRLIMDGQLIGGVAADDGVALHYVGTDLKYVVSSRPQAKAYSVTKNCNQLQESALMPTFLGNRAPFDT